ncbi:MAG: helix-turn-helix transcriptional regulator [Labedaea sp.]
MGQADRPRADRVSAIAALDEPTRRRLYDYVGRQPAPVSRDDAADAMRLPRNTVAFHLDKLVTEGLMEVVYERRTGRSGPGAGRPSKLYRRSPRQVTVSLPERSYELAAHLLAGAVHEAGTSGQSPQAVLDRRAGELGTTVGRQTRTDDPDRDSHTAALHALETLGFEPRTVDRDIVLGNCPFHSLARQHTDLVCGMNLSLLNGLLDGLAATGLTARLDPAPGRCCVRIDPAVDPG